MGLFSRWKQGMKELTPLQLLRAKRISIYGQCAGLLVGMVVLYSSGFGYWLWFLGFTLALMITELVSTQKQIWKLEEFRW